MFKIIIEETLMPNVLGKSFINADDYDQCMFLKQMLEMPYGKWAMQCRYIANECEANMGYNERRDLVSMLECLVEHINEYQN